MFSMERILAPVDFSELSVGALRYVEALVSHFGSETILLHVQPPPRYEFSTMEIGGTLISEFFEARTVQIRKELDGFLKDDLPGLNPRRVLLEGDPARKIVEYAHDNSVDLIVVPTHGYGSFRRFILGSITAKILHDADCPVWTGVHLEEASGREHIEFRTIMAAVDLGAQSEKALAWASAMAGYWGARLILIHCLPCMEGCQGEGYDPDWGRHISDEARTEIDQLQQRVSSTAEVMIENGEAPEAICSAAKQIQAGLLVIGRGSAAGVFGRLRANAY